MIQLKTLNKAPFGYTALSAIPAGLDHLCNHSGSFVMKEIWKDIPGFNNYYQVSNLGRVKSIERIVCAGRNGGVKTVKEKIKKAYVNVKRYGYNYIHLMYESYSLHRLVWISFNGIIPQNLEINHIDGNKCNNCLSNLELVTSSQNKIHAYKNGLNYSLKSKNNPKSKPIFSINQKGTIKHYDCISDVVKDGFNKGCVISCLKMRRKAHKKHSWYYEKL